MSPFHYDDDIEHETFSFAVCKCNISERYNKLCIGGESNPGLPRGRREFYHWTTNAMNNTHIILKMTFFLLTFSNLIDMKCVWHGDIAWQTSAHGVTWQQDMGEYSGDGSMMTYLVCSPYTRCWGHMEMVDRGQDVAHISETGTRSPCHSLGHVYTQVHTQWWCPAWGSGLAHICRWGFLATVSHH